MDKIKMALEALIAALDEHSYTNDYCGIEVSKHNAPKVWNAIEEARSALAALSQPVAPQEAVVKAIHYPDCWDTAAYPTLESALNEVYAHFKCSECAAPAPHAQVSEDSILKLAEAHGLVYRQEVEFLNPYKEDANISAHVVQFARALLGKIEKC